jgi:hypothetical protein
MSDQIPTSPKGWAQLLTALRETPGWLLAGLAGGLWALLYAMNGGYVQPGPFGEVYRLTILTAASITSALFVARLLQVAWEWTVRRHSTGRARRLLAFGESLEFGSWNVAKQGDGRQLTHFMMTVVLHNRSPNPLRLSGFALHSPKFARRRVLNLHLQPVGNQRSASGGDQRGIPPYETAGVRVVGMVDAVLAPPGGDLTLRFVVWDQFGTRYRTQKFKIASPPEKRPMPSLTRRLAFQLRRLAGLDPLPPEPERPIAQVTPLPSQWERDDNLKIVFQVLQEEQRSYASNGRQRGGLGSLNVSVQSGPDGAGTIQGKLPKLLWDPLSASDVASTNLDRLLRVHSGLDDNGRRRMEQALLDHLHQMSPYANVAYLIYLTLFRLNRGNDALVAARANLKGDGHFGYSNVLSVISAIVSHEHHKLSADLLNQIREAIDGETEHDFDLRKKITTALVERLDEPR